MKRIELAKLKTLSLKDRKNKVKIKQFAQVSKSFSRTIPDILAGENFKNLIRYIHTAKKRNKPIIFMFGAHVIKCGLSPLIIELMRRGFISFLATNGASLVHDFEIAYNGMTSEDVGEAIKKGNFGTARETGEFVNRAVNIAAEHPDVPQRRASERHRQKRGLGETFGKEINKCKFRHRKLSIFAQADNYGVPITVHVAIGTDVVHQHKQCDGASWGESSYNDFLKFIKEVTRLSNGGVVLNFGSAVILPEVFLKAVNIGRNLGYKIENFTAANFDMNLQYRPIMNIISRPVARGGKGYNFVGHHEIMLPLLYAGVVNQWK